VDEPDGGQEPVLSALEEAFRQALATAKREQVLARLAACLVDTALPAEDDTDPAASEPGRGSASKVQKISVSMPTDLADLVRSRTGAGGFSRYVTEAVQEQIRLDLLADLSAELEAEYGPVDEDQVNQAMREWPDFAAE
jgi:Arc/MetJ-type ribon-helix-helix transcriptional regulator